MSVASALGRRRNTPSEHAVGTFPENDVPFSKADEVVIENFMQLVGITLRNVEVYKDAIAHCKRAQGMLSMLNSLPKNLGTVLWKEGTAECLLTY